MNSRWNITVILLLYCNIVAFVQESHLSCKNKLDEGYFAVMLVTGM